MPHRYGNAASEHLRAAHRGGKERGAPIDQDLEAIPFSKSQISQGHTAAYMHFLITAADPLCNPSNYVVTWKPEDAIGYPVEAVFLPGSRMEFLLTSHSRTFDDSMTNA
ncbi:hypothetical protein BOTNAR_0060g00190 [Botryotinia narcissicola]|uniref:Uncharacterized protein n=1 Tax=Botryotinia narcissicola TaxID=278944 RepID=A0A4Z1IYJ7_9HELO|nr:hypothetical protein BOTNAR_0060g00190 [Botryotinia narcissicola]